MSRLERIKAREEATEKRSGRQDASWEEKRREELRELEFQREWDDMPNFRRYLICEDYAVGMGGP